MKLDHRWLGEMKNKHSLEYLKSILSYDSQSGIFTWLVCKGRRIKQGQIAGTILNNGYRKIIIDGVQYLEHRLAWFFENGKWPDNEIDHIDTNKTNNAIKNLRQATNIENHRNTNKPSNNTSGFKGVSYHKTRKKYYASIKVKNKLNHLGSFNTPKEAHAAYCDAAKRLFGEFARF